MTDTVGHATAPTRSGISSGCSSPTGSVDLADLLATPFTVNNAPAGTFSVTGTTPIEDQPLTVSIAGVTDADNIGPGNPTGTIPAPVAYFWQSGTDRHGRLRRHHRLAAGEIARVEGTTFTPGDAEVGLRLRVRAVYKDANGVLEEVFSAPTAPVANVNDAPTGRPTISDTTPTQDRPLTASTTSIADADGLTTAVFTYQWQQATTAGGHSPISPAPRHRHSRLWPPRSGRFLRVSVTFTDDHGTTETLLSAATGGSAHT